MTIIPTPWVMALVFVTFLILVYLLNRILYKPLLGFMEARDSSIKILSYCERGFKHQFGVNELKKGMEIHESYKNMN